MRLNLITSVCIYVYLVSKDTVFNFNIALFPAPETVMAEAGLHNLIANTCCY